MATMLGDNPERVVLEAIANWRLPNTPALTADGLEKCRSARQPAGDEPNDRIPEVVRAS